MKSKNILFVTSSIVIFGTILLILIYNYTSVKYFNFKLTGKVKTCNSKIISQDIGAFVNDMKVTNYSQIHQHDFFKFKLKDCWIERRLLYPKLFCDFKLTKSLFQYSIILFPEQEDISSYGYGWELALDSTLNGFKVVGFQPAVLFADIVDTLNIENKTIYVLSNKEFSFISKFDTIASFQLKFVKK